MLNIIKILPTIYQNKQKVPERMSKSASIAKKDKFY